MPTSKPVKLILLGRKLRWPERELSLDEMNELQILHKTDQETARREEVRQQVQTGDYWPILLTRDRPHVVIDGHMRLQACKDLQIPVKAMFTPLPRQQALRIGMNCMWAGFG